MRTNIAFMKIILVSLFVALFLSVPLSVSSAEDTVTFNFVDVDLPVVAKYVSDITGKNFIFDEKFRGQVTIVAPSKLSAQDGFKLFTSVLELKGFTVVPSGVNAYKIIPTSLAKQKGLVVSTKGRAVNESYIARLVQLSNISSEEAVKFLRPVVSRDGHISSFGPGNLILIIDSGLNIKKILSIIDTIDQPSTLEVPEIVFLKNASADEVARMINDGMQLDSRVQKGRAVQQSSGRVVADSRLNAVIIFGPKETRESLKRLVAVLDVPAEDEHGRLNVYFLENADAEEMAEVLQGVVKGIEEAKKKAQKGQRTAPKIDQKIVITPDKSSNSLIILASTAEYRNVLSVIKKLDKRKKQVYVEAMIVEASIDNLFELGSRWRGIVEQDGDPVVIGGVGIMDQSAMQSIIYGLSGASVGGMGNFLDIPITTIGDDGSVSQNELTVPGFSALFSLQEFKGIVDILSTPQILTSDNEEAEIVVGENVPFITSKESDPTRDVSVFSNIERQDVGVKLTITPQIAEGDYVRLDVYQEISSVIQGISEDIVLNLGPSTTLRSTKTNVVVRDGQTVVIGGLMEEKSEENITKVPILGDIPLLGWLFKFRTTSKEKTNLMVFLTPHIIDDADDLSSLTHEKGTEYARTANMYTPGQLLVRFKPDVSEERLDAILKETDATVASFIENLNVYVISIPRDRDVEEAVEDFLSYDEVQYAEPNYKFHIKKSTRSKTDYKYNVTGSTQDENH
jgi:general secretion pathway protein D